MRKLIAAGAVLVLFAGALPTAATNPALPSGTRFYAAPPNPGTAQQAKALRRAGRKGVVEALVGGQRPTLARRSSTRTFGSSCPASRTASAIAGQMDQTTRCMARRTRRPARGSAPPRCRWPTTRSLRFRKRDV